MYCNKETTFEEKKMTRIKKGVPEYIPTFKLKQKNFFTTARTVLGHCCTRSDPEFPGLPHDNQ